MTDPADPAAAKAALRQRLLSRRLARTPEERDAAAAAVASALVGGLDGVATLATLATLAAFVPDPTEPGSGRLPAAYAELGARVLPVIPGEGHALNWAEYTGDLEPGRFGLSQPVGPRLGFTAIWAADVVVPALAVDRHGIRLGRGGGYYDRALMHARPEAVLVTVVFDDERVEDLPREAHDRPVTAVVTPGGGWQELDHSPV